MDTIYPYNLAKDSKVTFYWCEICPSLRMSNINGLLFIIKANYIGMTCTKLEILQLGLS